MTLCVIHFLVYFIKIDKDVIEVCREHLREICGSSLDKMDGPNYMVRGNESLEYIFILTLTYHIQCNDPDPEVIKKFACSSQLSMKFQMLI